MKATGIVRKMDELGRIVLPIELRNRLDIGPKDPIEIFTDGDTIVLKKYQPCCILCGDVSDNVLIKEKRVCKKCIEELNLRK